jgi:acyl-CoA thioesterase I
VREIGRQLGIPVIHRYDLMLGWLKDHIATFEELIAPDGLHIADGGYALLARFIAQELATQARSEGKGPL